MNNLVIITGVSASGKTTLQQEMLSRGGWKRPINFTTRKPRREETIEELKKNSVGWNGGEGSLYDDFVSSELDEYVFLTKDQFAIKLKNGDFLENTNYGGNFYGVSKFLPKGNVCVILDPIGRAQVLEKFNREGFDGNIFCFYIEVNKIVQGDRLRKRGDGKEEVDKRAKDFNWFHPTPNSFILDGTKSTEELIEEMESIIFGEQ